MMAGEIQEPLNLSLLENSIHSGSVSFGRFEKEVLSWERKSSFSQNRYLEEAEKFSKPGSVTQMRAHFEAHFKSRGIRLPTSVEAETWGGVAQHHHQRNASEKDENLWEIMSQCSDKEKSQFSDSCVSYESYDDYSSVSLALEKTGIGCIERSIKDKVETTFSSAATLKPLKNDRKAIPSYAETTKTSAKKHVVIAKGSSSCNTKTSFDTKRGKELKPTRIVKSIASQALVTKKTDSITPLATNKFRSKNCMTNGFSSRSKVEKRKEENVEAIARKSLNVKARPVPKITQARPQHTSTGQEKARSVVQEHSSKASCDRSLANGAAKSKPNINKQVDTQRSLSGTRPKNSDHTAKNKANGRSLAVRRSAVEVAL